MTWWQNYYYQDAAEYETGNCPTNRKLWELSYHFKEKFHKFFTLAPILGTERRGRHIKEASTTLCSDGLS